MNFLDSTIFINWFKAAKRDLSKLEVAASGFILRRIEDGESTLTSTIVKDEASLWLARYKRSVLPNFLDSIQSYTSLKIEPPIMEDQLEAEHHLGLYRLGYLDCINLAMMQRNRINTIYSSDTGFDAVPGVRRVLQELSKDRQFPSFQKWARESL